MSSRLLAAQLVMQSCSHAACTVLICRCRLKPLPHPHQILECATLASTSFAIATRHSHPDSSGRKHAGGSSGCGDCSIWLLGCAPLCAAVASSASTLSQALVPRARVWAAPADRPKVHVTLDEESHSSDVRLLPLAALNLLAVCCSNGSVYLLNTHGALFTIRSTFSRHSQLVHALAVCEHEGLVISGGVSRSAATSQLCLPRAHFCTGTFTFGTPTLQPHATSCRV